MSQNYSLTLSIASTIHLSTTYKMDLCCCWGSSDYDA